MRIGGYCSKHQAEGRQQRNRRRESEQWHRLYDTAKWKEMRTVQLIKEPFCRMCAAKGLRVLASDVDHIKPHRGDLTLFEDESNLQSLCHRCHSIKTMAEQMHTPGAKMF